MYAVEVDVEPPPKQTFAQLLWVLGICWVGLLSVAFLVSYLFPSVGQAIFGVCVGVVIYKSCYYVRDWKRARVA